MLNHFSTPWGPSFILEYIQIFCSVYLLKGITWPTFGRHKEGYDFIITLLGDSMTCLCDKKMR